LYDYPQIAFGSTDGKDYGIWLWADFFAYVPSFAIYDVTPAIAFLPILGLGSYGQGKTRFLNDLTNQIYSGSATGSSDGRFWYYGMSGPAFSATTDALNVLFKSPGTINNNYAGPFEIGQANAQYELLNPKIFHFDSVPTFGIFTQAVQGVIFDEQRQALYVLSSISAPMQSQSMRLYFSISRNNGQTWSDPIDIASSTKANRGFASMALDSVSGNLFIGWYDGRNDLKNLRDLQYFGAMVSSAQLDAWVKDIPVSNPTYSIPNQGYDAPLP